MAHAAMKGLFEMTRGGRKPGTSGQGKADFIQSKTTRATPNEMM
jgi:hypothetical protein